MLSGKVAAAHGSQQLHEGLEEVLVVLEERPEGKLIGTSSCCGGKRVEKV